MTDFSRAEDHILNQILSAPLQQDPFDHCVVDKVFPIDLYKTIHRYWPPVESMVQISETGTVAGYKDRFCIPLENFYFNKLDSVKGPFWEKLSEAISSSRVISECMKKFAPIIRERVRGKPKPYSFQRRCLLISDKNNFELGPHTDIESKVMSLLFYLPESDNDRHIGTKLYKAKDEDLYCKGNKHWAFDKFVLSKTIDFIPNRLLMFPRTSRSFHGVAALNNMKDYRKLIVINISL